MASKETKKMTARMLSVVLAASVFLLLAAPSALAAAPALKLVATSQPTTFVPGLEGILANSGPQYNVMVTNVGSAPTSGPITITDTVPAGLTVVEVVGRDFYPQAGNQFPLTCNVSGQTVTCTDPEPLNPGQWAQIEVLVKVDENLSGVVINQASAFGGGAAEEASASTMTTIGESTPSFCFVPGSAGLSVASTNEDGQPATQAGSHPYGLTIDLGFPSAETNRQPVIGGQLYAAGHLRDLKVTLPRGVVVDPTAVPARCTEAELESEKDDAEGGCPIASQVGTLSVLTSVNGLSTLGSPLYNMVPPPGAAAELGANAGGLGIFVHVMGGVNSAGEYEIASNTSNILARALNPVIAAQAQLWGNPSDPGHDAMRGVCPSNGDRSCSIPTERRDVPFLTMPSSCRSSLTLNGAADSWEEPNKQVSRSVELEDPLGNPTPTDGCNALDFEPEIKAKPTTNLSDAPTGLDFNLHVPQTDKFEERATANFKDVAVTFPPGLVVNPASANGLGACSLAQIGYAPSEGKPRFDETPAQCPDAAKIGAVEVFTPLLKDPLPGALYVAQPYRNPFGSLLAIYLAIDDPGTGVVSKLAGKVQADPITGQLTTTFDENPELPIEDVKLKVFGGPRAALKTPLPCGEYAITSRIVPWSTPEGANASPSDSFQTSVAAGGSGPCPASEAAAPKQPAFSAGTLAPQAGAYSPFLLKLSRPDGSQRLTAIDTTLPKGLAAKLAGVPYCSEAQIAQAKTREAPNQGSLELQSPSCPRASEVGTVNVGAGAGITPIYVQGRAYLAGPYKGAPLSLVIVTPAVAGPYDLGAVVNRTALYVDPESAQVHAVSDPLPSIIDGIPLDVRSIAVKMDRPTFTLNPTSCDPMAILGSATTLPGQSAPLTSPFQVGGCNALGFKPKLALSLKGATRRTGHPALKAVLTYPQGSYANVASAQVTLPHSEFLDTTHIKTICTRVQFAVKACPKASIYGFARATSPLLDQPLEGPVYLRSSSHKLPDLVIALGGQIEIDLAGRVDSVHSATRTRFETAPDAPVTRFVLEMQGGRKGLLVNSEDICRKPQHAVANFTGQNGKVSDTKPLIANGCKHKAKAHHRAQS
jgi:hypothetical protein